VGDRRKNWHENEIISRADSGLAEVGQSMTTDKHASDLGPVGIRALAVGAQALGALALGALAVGALALGAVAIGQLAIGRSRIRRLEIDELVVKKIRITESLETPTPS
jgi:hypothetical protein